MQSVKIPNYIAKKIDKDNKNFFWKNNMDPDFRLGPIPLISWDKICRPKCERGLGIRKTQDVNATMLAKLRWKVLNDSEKIWVEVVNSKYLNKVNFFQTRKTSIASPM